MNTKALATLGILATAVCAATEANAEPRWPNWYVGVHGGVNMHPDSDLSAGGVSSEVQTDTGYAFGASLGYLPPAETGLLSVSRWEVEYTYRRNDIQSVGGVSTDGTADSHNFMFNWLVDFMNDTYLTPYVGAGIGMSNIELSDVSSADDNVMAWQLLAGLGYEPETMPNTIWGIGYRYFDTEDAGWSNGGLATEFEYSSHTVEANARFRF